jgi:hypothetical protein
VNLSINRVSPYSFKLVALSSCFEFIISYDFESLICISQERERDTSYVRCAQRLFVILLLTNIILSLETDVHESQSTTKIIV